MSKTSPKPIALNAEQQVAVNAGEGAWAIVAGPGAGKTSVLVARYIRLRKTVSAEQVLSLTFTRSAAAEMRSRVGDLDLAGGKPSGFLTFHAFCLAVVTEEADKFGYPLQHFPLATPGQAAKFLGEVCRRHQLDFRTLQLWISNQKRQGIRGTEAVRKADDTAESQQLALAYKEFETKLREAGLMDFDSLQLEVVDLLTRDLEARARYQYRFVMVDEFQDTDEVQTKLVQLLSEKHGNVFAVGDANQSIYNWRGASSDVLLNFTDYFPNGKLLYLNTNYRATKCLTAFNYKIAPHAPPDPYTSPAEDGEEPHIDCWPNESDEAAGVAKQIRQMQGVPGSLLFDIGGPPNIAHDVNAAILARTNRSLRIFEEKLSESGIRYHLLGKSGYFSQPEIRNCLAYIQCAVYPTDAAVTAALRAPFHPSKFIKKKDVLEWAKLQQLRAEGRDDKALLLSILPRYVAGGEQQLRAINQFHTYIHQLARYRGAPAQTAVQGILTDLRAVQYYAEEEESLDNDPVQNLNELVRIANRFQTLPELLDHVRKVQAASRMKKGVALGTIHSAKGLEWQTVFMVNCQEGVLPHVKGELEEEKRIFFVGCSRAAKRLVISYSGPPSQFLAPFIEEMETA